MQKAIYWTNIIALMLVLFIDGLGQGIIFPILSKTLTSSDATLFVNTSGSSLRHIWFGLIVGSYYLMWFIAAPLLGDWSDSVGRKKPLLICLGLAAISFLIAALAFQIASLSLLLLSRLIGGATSGDQAIAKAAVIDICPEKNRSVYLGMVLCAVTLGLVVGPLIGSYLQNISYFLSSGSQTPFYFAAMLALGNMLLLQCCFAEQKTTPSATKIKLIKAIQLIVDGFKAKEIKQLLIVYVMTQLAWQIFYIDMQEFAIYRCGVTIGQASMALALLGVGIFIGLAVLPRMFRRCCNKTVGTLGYTILATCIAIVLLNKNITTLFAISVIAAAFFGLAAVNMLTMFTTSTTANQQGWIMGLTGAVVAFTGGIGALASGVLSSINLFIPYIFSFVLIVIAVSLLQSS